ncbi:MAG: hypothetical protein ACOCYB_04275 [Alkalispirochaeta sp.]
MHGNPIRSYWWYLAVEFSSPINYLIAGLVGLIIQVGQGNVPWASLLPYVTPVVVQSFSKATVKYRDRYNRLLLQLPAERPDPALVVDRSGGIMAVAGRSADIVSRNRARRLHDLVLAPACPDIDRVLGGTEPAHVTCYSDGLAGWFEIHAVPVHEGAWWLVWMQNVTSREETRERLATVHDAIEELVSTYDELSSRADLDVATAQIGFSDGFRAVFVARDDGTGDLRGRVFRTHGGAVQGSQEIPIPESSAAAVLLSRRERTVVIRRRPDDQDAASFCAEHGINPHVAELVGEPIDNFVNYHRGSLAVVLFNRVGGVGDGDRAVVESLLNTVAIFDTCLASR